MVVSFQNFSLVDVKDLRPELTSARAAQVEAGLNDSGEQDIREFAPRRPANFGQPTIAMPDSGRDPGTIGLNWLGKQTDLMTDGADQRMLLDMNKQLNRITKFTPVEGEPWPEPGNDDGKVRDPSSVLPNIDGTDDGTNDQSADPKLKKSSQDSFALTPKSVHFSQLNRFEMKFATATQLSCLVGNGGVELDLQRPINPRMDVGLRHQTSTQASTLHMQYNW